MAKSVFYSFHYDRDAMRVQQVMKIGALEGQPLLNSQDWEQVRRSGDDAIRRWIDGQMAYKKAVVVLVGAQTASRRWVLYEIDKAWRERKPLVGVRIHGLEDPKTGYDGAGTNPFSQVLVNAGNTVASYASLHDPTCADGSATYRTIERNLTQWVDNAYRKS